MWFAQFPNHSFTVKPRAEERSSNLYVPTPRHHNIHSLSNQQDFTWLSAACKKKYSEKHRYFIISIISSKKIQTNTSFTQIVLLLFHYENETKLYPLHLDSWWIPSSKGKSTLPETIWIVSHTTESLISSFHLRFLISIFSPIHLVFHITSCTFLSLVLHHLFFFFKL